MNWPVICCFNWCIVMVYCFSQNVEYTTECTFANRYCDWCAGIYSIHSTHKTIGRTHSNGTNYIITDMLHNFSCQMNFDALTDFTVDFDCVINSWKAFRWEFNVDNRANNLYYFASIQCFPSHLFYCRASAPPTISLISLVIPA